ncbi:protein usg [Mesorhizobium sp.]|uniref:protein usg n=1 Tax=Mesorhizobium sp. TaxID=1871066 RepID=UPI000FE6FE81|nr:protein usg [Mesorhizobium sp.]RWC26352.1 MAG: protein usg [Mesorhizobium sp.]TIX20782.1 MAG: protein usg [Mesorhizobium sp.]
MDGYGLTRAEILYHLPGHPSLLQLYVWQEYDLAPEFPELKGFLDYWERELEGALHSVCVAHSSLNQLPLKARVPLSRFGDRRNLN